MTITRRNRLIRRIAEVLAERDGHDAVFAHQADVSTEPDARHYTRCCEHAYEDAARNTYHHLTDRRVYHSPRTGRAHLAIGLPELQRMLAPSDPPKGWVDRAIKRATELGALSRVSS